MQCLLKAWLTEKEDSLNQVQTSNFKDQKELGVNVRKLAVSITWFAFGNSIKTLNVSSCSTPYCQMGIFFSARVSSLFHPSANFMVYQVFKLLSKDIG